MWCNEFVLDANMTLESERVRLEPLAARHLPELVKRCNDESIWQYTFQRNPFSNDVDAKRWIDDALRSSMRGFAIVDKVSGAVAGSTRYTEIVPEHRKLEIGWTFLAQAFWRTHVNTEAKFLLLRHAFEEWDALRVQLKGEAINSRSRAAMEHIGATFEGTLRSFRIQPVTGEVRDTSFYSILAAEWPAVKSRLEARIRDTRAAV